MLVIEVFIRIAYTQNASIFEYLYLFSLIQSLILLHT